MTIRLVYRGPIIRSTTRYLTMRNGRLTLVDNRPFNQQATENWFKPKRSKPATKTKPTGYAAIAQSNLSENAY